MNRSARMLDCRSSPTSATVLIALVMGPRAENTSGHSERLAEYGLLRLGELHRNHAVLMRNTGRGITGRFHYLASRVADETGSSVALTRVGKNLNNVSPRRSRSDISRNRTTSETLNETCRDTEDTVMRIVFMQFLGKRIAPFFFFRASMFVLSVHAYQCANGDSPVENSQVVKASTRGVLAVLSSVLLISVLSLPTL
jgi:hypothetical protein